MECLLRLEKLRVSFASDSGRPVIALDEISFDVEAGEILGVLGESGAGKTTLALSLLGLLPETAQARGSIRYRERELLGSSEHEMEKIRGAEISMIFQEPGLALHPALTVGEQVADVIRAHSSLGRRHCRERAKAVLAEVSLKGRERIYSAYPHELSGGERQRVAIAQALICQPSLLIADEPTASLDSTVRSEILSLLRDICSRLGVAILLISHSPALLAKLAQRLIVMSAGRIVEQGPAGEVLSNPAHVYTRALVELVPQRLN